MWFRHLEYGPETSVEALGPAAIDDLLERGASTLIVHARDDLLQLLHNGAFAAATIPGAELLSFDAGGHVVIAVERNAIRAAVREHILDHATSPTFPSTARRERM